MNDKAFFLNDEIISDLLLLNLKIDNIDEFPNKLIKIIHLMVEGSGKVAWLESNHFVGSSPTRGDIFFF